MNMHHPIPSGGSRPSLVGRLLEIILPGGGCSLALVETYFDESGSHKGAETLCIAGYLFGADESRHFEEECRALLEKWDLPYFHMVDCAHGSGVFKKIDVRHRSLIAANMIGLIKRWTIQGVAVAVDLVEFERRFGKSSFFGTAYTLGVHIALNGIATWALKTGYPGEIAYIFEAGHESQPEANAIINFGATDPRVRADTHYAGHAFVDKAKAPQLQAADLLAWQWAKDIKMRREGKSQRKDFLSLGLHPHVVTHVGSKQLAHFEDMWKQQSDEIESKFGRYINYAEFLGVKKRSSSSRA